MVGLLAAGLQAVNVRHGAVADEAHRGNAFIHNAFTHRETGRTRQKQESAKEWHGERAATRSCSRWPPSRFVRACGLV